MDQEKKKFEILPDGSMVFRCDGEEYTIPEVKAKEARELFRKTEVRLKENRRTAAAGLAAEYEAIKRVSPELAEALVKEAVADAKKNKTATEALSSADVAEYLNSTDGVVFWMGEIFRRTYPAMTDEQVYNVLIDTSADSAELLKKEMGEMWKEAAAENRLPEFGPFAVRDRITKRAMKKLTG